MSEPQTFPAWFYGPDGAADVFNSEADVPKGWADHPSKVAKKADKAEAPADDEAAAGKKALAEARKAHKAKFGKLPGPKATLEEINAKLAAAEE